MTSAIILIGPIRSGKSTQGRLLADALGVPQVSLDEHCWRYYEEIGFEEAGQERYGSDGMIAARFNLHAVERLLTDYRDGVMDLGAGHSVYRDEASLAILQRLLAPYPHVFLLLPSPDLDESARILWERNRANTWLNTFQSKHDYNPNEHFLRHASNFAPAKFVIYTGNKTPEQTRDEILALRHHYA